MANQTKTIVMVVEKTDTGFSAFSKKYPIFTTAETVPILINNTYEAISFYFEDDDAFITSENVRFEIDFKQFFKSYRVLNANFLAKKIGMNPTLLSQYIQGHKRPSAQQTERILQGIHKIGVELSQITLLQTT